MGGFVFTILVRKTTLDTYLSIVVIPAGLAL